MLAIEAYGPKIGVGVVTTCKNGMCILVNTVEMSYSSEITFSTIPVACFVCLSAAVVPVISAC